MREIELILTHIFNCKRSDLYLKRFSWDEEKLSRLNEILSRRRSHYPLAYLLGEIEFMGFNFKVKEGVFIPRPETEILVEKVINLATNYKLQTTNYTILDIGTGCGNIAVSLAKFLPNSRIIATDISSLALEVAEENAIRNKVEERIEFIQADLFPNHKLQTTNYIDIIVSNPPYISTREIESLPLEVQFEPRISLDGGEDGLDFYRRIIYEAPNCLKENGFLILEMGFNQKEAIKDIFRKSGNFKINEIIKDYNDIDRIIVAQLVEGKWINS